jgi:hypothetical protein
MSQPFLDMLQDPSLYIKYSAIPTWPTQAMSAAVCTSRLQQASSGSSAGRAAPQTLLLYQVS